MNKFYSHNGILIGDNGRIMGKKHDPYNPYDLQPFTVRYQFGNLNYDPTVDYGGDWEPSHGYPTWQSWWGYDCYWTRVSTNPNIWDYTINNTNWYRRLTGWKFNIKRDGPYYDTIVPCETYTILGINATGVLRMQETFYDAGCRYGLPLFDTSTVTTIRDLFRQSELVTLPDLDFSNVEDAGSCFYNCDTLRNIPSKISLPKCTQIGSFLYECDGLTYLPELELPSTITGCDRTFGHCPNVRTGILRAYNYLSSLTITGTQYANGHESTFYKCGTNTTTGAAELAQVPSDWKEPDDIP